MNDKMIKSTEDSGFATRDEFSSELLELQSASQTEAARQEIQASILLAKRFPRNENAAYQRIINSCRRPSFAESVHYTFPRGGQQIMGPSIYFAREFARIWGNIRYGVDILADEPERRTIRAWAWDLETNVKVNSDVTFEKKILRKNVGWITPDERDLRELTNRHAAIAKRNCLLELLPADMVEDACAEALKTLQSKAKEDPDAQIKSIIKAFAEIRVPLEEIEAYLEHPISQCSPDDIVNLRTIYKSIKAGESVWAEYYQTRALSAAPTHVAEEVEKLGEKIRGLKTSTARVAAPAKKAATAAAKSTGKAADAEAETDKAEQDADNTSKAAGTTQSQSELVEQILKIADELDRQSGFPQWDNTEIQSLAEYVLRRQLNQEWQELPADDLAKLKAYFEESRKKGA